MVNNPGVPKECFEQYGQDLDGCSTQENEGCSRCRLFNGNATWSFKIFAKVLHINDFV